MKPTHPSLVVLVSGNGTNLQAILDACACGWLGANVVGVVSNKPGIPAITRATRSNVPAIVIEPVAGEERVEYDARLAAIVREMQPDLVVLAGFMRILSNEFLKFFPTQVVNLHPALPGELPGTNAIERAFAESHENWRTHSGITVHFVPDEGVDTGPVIASEVVPIYEDDTFEMFAERMHECEHALLVHTLSGLCQKIILSRESESVS
jgi:phosphoribosylglycinamide formyltransferase-1